MPDEALTEGLTLLNSERFTVQSDGSQGGKITSIYDHEFARNLLLDDIGHARLQLEDDAEFGISGWDEAFPTLEPSSDAPTLGWAWRTQPEVLAEDRKLIHKWQILGWEFERRISLDGSTIKVSVNCRNFTDVAAKALWASHVLYPLAGTRQINLPEGDLVAGPGCDISEVFGMMQTASFARQLSSFDSVAKSWKFFVNAGAPVTLDYGDLVLKLETDAPWWGIWLNLGWMGLSCVGIEPTNAPTDHQHEVQEPVQAGESVTYNWSLSVEAKQ